MRAILISTLILIVFAAGCVPPKTVINTSKEDNVSNFNKEVKEHKIEITLINDQKVEGEKAHLESDSLIYNTSGHLSVVNLSDIRYVTISPKYSPISFQSMLMIGGGIFCLTTVGSSSFGAGYTKITMGALAVVLGTIYYLTWAPEESKIYYFNK